MRLITARSSVRRNSRGRGLPACGSGVTVPHSTKPKPAASMAAGNLGVLVEAGGEADGVGQAQAGEIHGQDRVVGAGARGPRPIFRPDGQTVGVFGIEPAQQAGGDVVQAQSSAPPP